MGKSEYLTTHFQKNSKKGREAMEGAASGFGNKLQQEEVEDDNRNNLEGENGRMRAVYVT